MATKRNLEPILKVRNLKQYFKTGMGKNKLLVKAVDDVSFDVYPSEVFSLVGESGCGKTTTGRSIIKLYKPTDGEVIFKGVRISSGNQTRKENIKQIKRTAKDQIEKVKGIYVYSQNIEEINANAAKEIQTLKMETRDKILKIKEKQGNPEEIKALKTTLAQKIKAAKSEASSKVSDVKENRRTHIKEARYDQDEVARIQAEAQDKIRDIKKDIILRDKETDNPDSELMRKMQMIFQDPIESLNPRMTVKEIIAEGLRIAGEKNDTVIIEKVNKVLETVGLLPEHASRYPHEFSGGQRQRIGIARALVVNPELIIADEPISALDVSIQAQVINLLNDLREQLNLTLLFIAHDLSVVKYFSDRIGVMYFGKMVELAPKDELFKNPFHPYTKSLLSAVPVPDPNFEKSRPPRIKYDPRSHNYTPDDLPTLKEITPGHFILASEKEYKQYQKDLKV
jgi:oligopeptide transport system ATP-binding protein